MNRKAKTIEELAKGLPVPPLPGRVWEELEKKLDQPVVLELQPRHNSYYRYAIAACLLIGVSLAVYLFEFNNPQNEYLEHSTASLLIESADDDLDMAIMYYERAIEKLEQAGAESSDHLPPEMADLYAEKVANLKASIAECKEVLEYNHSHSNVRTALFTSYIALQETLSDMNVQSRSQQSENGS